MNVGVIGMGNMGHSMAGSLLRAGHTVTVYNRSAGKADDLVQLGARQAASVAEVAACEAFITMLSNDHAVESTVEELLPAMGGTTVHISSSTISVACCDRLATKHQAAGRPFISAPVWGRPEVARAGKLKVVAAGEAGAVERCRPLLEAIGEKLFVLGTTPSFANLAKISGNFMIAAIIEGLSEAYALMRKSGVDAATYDELLRETLFTLPVQATYSGIIAAQKFDPPGFKATLGLKDVRLVQEAAEAVSVPMPLASLLHDQFVSAVAQGHGDQDWTIIARVAAERAGLH